MDEQEHTSAATSRNQVPAVYKKVMFRAAKRAASATEGWVDGTRNLDLGGGKFDLFTEALAKEGVHNLILDPYNRSEEHNRAVIVELERHGADTVTISNVLNVIKEFEVRAHVLRQALLYLNRDGRIYITVYEGDGRSEGKETRDGWQEHRPLRSYLEEVRKVFGSQSVECKAGIITHHKV